MITSCLLSSLLLQVTDDTGQAALRAFKGAYEATVTFPDATRQDVAFEIGSGPDRVVRVEARR